MGIPDCPSGLRPGRHGSLGRRSKGREKYRLGNNIFFEDFVSFSEKGVTSEFRRVRSESGTCFPRGRFEKQKQGCIVFVYNCQQLNLVLIVLHDMDADMSTGFGLAPAFEEQPRQHIPAPQIDSTRKQL